LAYISNTPEEQQEMLAAIGVDSVETLFKQIPDELRFGRTLDLPRALSEMELEQSINTAIRKNVGTGNRVCFQGGGVYQHYIPSAVDAIAGRSEFYTAYTPYQAEASQGSLQAFFEYQSLICELTGMDVSNASLYEGGTAVSEAVFMAMRCTRRHGKVVVLGSVHPEYRQILDTYLENLDSELHVVEPNGGTVDADALRNIVDDSTACVVIQQPNFFGCLEDVEALIEVTHDAGALAVVSFDPISLGMLKRPGDYGADIAVAEGQSLGIPMQYGGPFLGILACQQKFVRQVPGRLIGKTVDKNGKDCFVLNLQAREQHIRREKATSNICTNQGLMALRATVYMSLLGPQGFREVADRCCQNAHYAASRLTEIDGIELAFAQPFFKEFTLKCERGADTFIQTARQAGFDVGPAFKELGEGNNDEVLVAATECRNKDEIDRLADAFKNLV
jgi:glycine dehydrogenase subunit 1